MNKPRLLILAATITALAPAAALAHPNHDSAQTFVEALAHPLSGLDHVLMLIAVSAWAAALLPAGRVVVAASLGVFVAIGALLPVTPLKGPALEAAIALTVLGAGILLAMSRRWTTLATASVAATFALIHGMAHGIEGPAQSPAYLLGLAFATSSLAIGIAVVAAQLQSKRVWLRVAGAASAAFGALALLAA